MASLASFSFLLSSQHVAYGVLNKGYYRRRQSSGPAYSACGHVHLKRTGRLYFHGLFHPYPCLYFFIAPSHDSLSSCKPLAALEECFITLSSHLHPSHKQRAGEIKLPLVSAPEVPSSVMGILSAR